MSYRYSPIVLVLLTLLQFTPLSGQSFTEQTGIALPGVFYSAVAWGDYDNDGDLDLLVCGNNSSGTRISQVFRNDGGTTFTQQSSIVLEGVNDGEAAWGDYDNDGDLDILLHGYSGTSYMGVTHIYRNNGNNTFSEISNTGLPGMRSSSAKWGDYDNDGDLDILLAGQSTDEGFIARVYQNQGSDSLVEQEHIQLTGIHRCGVDWGDYNNDGLLDILLCGSSSEYPGWDAITKIYKNNGYNGFTEQSSFILNGTNWGKCVWGDYDNDGDLDFIFTGYPDEQGDATRIYRNDGGLNFTYQSQYYILRMSNSDVEWGDYDNDGDLDILMAGAGNARIYQNTGDDFVSLTDSDLTGIYNAAVAWGDYDHDGDLDFVLSGDTGGERITRIYKNNAATANTVPGTPTGPQVNIQGNAVTLSWNEPTDAETPQAALSYAIKVGTTPSGLDIASPMADLSTGYRRIPGPGHIQDNTWTLKNLEADTYYWSVQAIDHAFAGSAFSFNFPFKISYSNRIAPTDEQVLLPKSSGTLLTVSESETPARRQWKYSHSPGGPYNYNISGATGTSYTPYFAVPENYYVVCESEFEGVWVSSNEVKIAVQHFTEVTGSGLEVDRIGSLRWGDYDNDRDLDLLVGTGGSGVSAKVYRNNGDHTFSHQAGISLQGVRDDQAIWGDYNRDGHLDIFLSGAQDYGLNPESGIYLNNGNNTFSEQTDMILAGTKDCALVWADTDNDGDLDLINAGVTADDQQVCILYRNDGDSIYTEVEAGIIPFSAGVMDLGDYDQDGYPDLAIVGTDYSGNAVSRIYRNNGDNTFTEQSDINTKLLEEGSVAWGDYDNDGDVDLLLAGGNDNIGKDLALVYRNDGNNAFTELSAVELTGVKQCAVAWVDYDVDGDLDICIQGRGDDHGHQFNIYRNEANDSFIEQTHINLPGTYDAEMAWGDYDNDGDPDLVYAGGSPSGRIIKLYRNDILNSNKLPGTPNNLSSRAFAGGALLSWDIPNDAETPGSGLGYNVNISSIPGDINIKSPHSDLSNGYRKLPHSGNTWKNPFYNITGLDTGTYYWQVQAIDHGLDASTFSPLEAFTVLPDYTGFDPGMSPLDYADVIAGDYDADGDMDILITGEYDYNLGNTIIYRNDGGGSFTNINAGLADLGKGAVAWGDYDLDGDIDLIVAGSSNGAWNGATTSLYRNDGSDSFSEQTSVGLLGLYQSDVKWGDLDNDGLPDIVISGNRSPIDSRIYRNNGDGTFQELEYTGLDKYTECSLDLADYDNDMDLDIVICGTWYGSYGQETHTAIYRNDGDFNYTDISADLVNVRSGTVAWGDYDNDGDLDLLVSGAEYVGDRYTKIYRNDGDDQFNEINAYIRGLSYASVEWGDCDNDGDLDLLFSGASGNNVCEIYRNDGADVFTEVDHGLLDDLAGEVSWIDYDSDRDLDIIYTGRVPGSVTDRISRIFTNNGNWSNDRPAAPSGLTAESQGYGVLLGWDAASDDQTPSLALSYNIRVGSGSNAMDIIAPMSDLSNGHRFVHAMGNCNLNTGWYLDSLAVGTYYWSVQAIDQTFLGGDWASEQSFTITSVNADFEADTICEGLSTSFTDLTITSGDPLTGWDWDFGDGETSVSQDPTHIYAASGTYTVRLIAHTAAYSDTIVKDVLVKPRPSADFIADVVCRGTGTTFTNNSMANGTSGISWLWDFGDGETSTDQDPGTHGYIIAGEYAVSLTALADNGCLDIAAGTASVGSLPVALISVVGDIEFCEGDSVILSNVYTEGFNYQWKNEGNNLTNADSSRYVARGTGTYTIEVTNPVGNCIDISDPKIVTSNPLPDSPTIINGGNTSFCQGDSVELSVTDIPGYTYNWKLDEGVVGSSHYIYMAKLHGDYSLEIISDKECKATSLANVPVTVVDTPAISVIERDGDLSFCEGEFVTLSVTDNAAWSFRWKQDGAVVGTTHSYSVSASGDYHAEATITENTITCVSSSNTLGITVWDAPGIPVISPNTTATICQGEEYILSVTEVAGLDYQWMKDGFAIPGGDLSTLQVESTGDYGIELTNADGCITTSLTDVAVTVIDTPTISLIEKDGPTVFCSGESVDLSVTNDPAATYQWFRDGFLQGSSSNTLSATVHGEYWLRAENTFGCESFSDRVDITVWDAPEIPVISPNTTATICQGEEYILSVTEVAGLDYQWMKDGFAIPGGDLHTLQVESTGDYGIELTNADECLTTSLADILVTVIDTPSISLIERKGDDKFCEGESATLFITENVAWTYKWKQDGALVGNLDSLIVTESGNYHVEAINTHNTLECIARSNTESINVISFDETPVIYANSDTEFCEGESVVLQTPEYELYTLSWNKDSIPQNVSTNEYEVTESGTYTVDIKIEGVGVEECSRATSNEISVLVLDKPEKLEIFSAEGFQMCEGESRLASVDDLPEHTYRWLQDGTAVPGETESSFHVSNPGDYILELRNNDGCSTQSNPKTFEVFEIPKKPLISEENGLSNICPGEELTLRVDNPISGYIYMWYEDGDYTNYSGTSFKGALDEAGYSVTAAVDELAVEKECTTPSDRLEITWKFALDKPDISAYGPNVWYLACSNDQANMYRWYYEENLVEDGANHLYVANQDMGKYRVEISDDGACYTSSDVISIPENVIIGMEEDIWENLKIYPNPTPGLFTLEMDNPVMGELVIDILSETGAMVLNIKFQKESSHFKTEIDLSGQPTAVYLINLILNEYMANRKLIVK